MDICRAPKRRGKYLPLFTNTEVNNYLVNTKPVDSQHQIVPVFLTNEEKLARETQNNAGKTNNRYYPEFE